MKPFIVAVALSAAGLIAPAAAQPAFPPPPPEYGAPPPPPGPASGFVLEPGHWQWNGGRYVWIRRHWIPTQVGYSHFVPGHWNPYGRWIPAHWAP